MDAALAAFFSFVSSLGGGRSRVLALLLLAVEPSRGDARLKTQHRQSRLLLWKWPGLYAANNRNGGGQQTVQYADTLDSCLVHSLRCRLSGLFFIRLFQHSPPLIPHHGNLLAQVSLEF
jgi:hypothetical protein